MRVQHAISFIASTYIRPDGKVICHIDDEDYSIYLVDNFTAWNGRKDSYSFIEYLTVFLQ